MERPVMVIVGDHGTLGRHLVGFSVRAGYFVLGISRRAAAEGVETAWYKHLERDVLTDPIALAEEIIATVGTPKTCIYNAGTFLDAPVLTTTNEQLARLVSVHFTAPFLIERELARHYQTKPYEENIEENRSIVNISSAAIRYDILLNDKRDISVYAATKAALATYSVAAAKEFIDFGVRLNAVAPVLFTGDSHRTERVAQRCLELAQGRMNGTVSD